MQAGLDAEKREIGVRLALGSTPARALKMILEQGGKLVGAGVAFGLAGAYALARLMRALLFGVAPFDAALFAVVTTVLVAVALVACLAPARRAARVDPSKLLRD